MKRDTIALYGADFQSSPRPQDFIDVKTLERLTGTNEADKAESGLLSRLGQLLGDQR